MPVSNTTTRLRFATQGTPRLRLWLALLLVLSPLLSIAQQGPLAGKAGRAAAVAMPCHALQAMATQGEDPQGTQNCPDCDAAAPAPGACCSPSPVGLADLAAVGIAPGGARLPSAAAHQEALPESPAETLYRPPIPLL